MTWSILAKDKNTGEFGVAVTTRFFGVGGICPHGAGQIGALCTQAQMNPLYGQDGMRLLAEGRSATEIVAILTAADPGKAVRQLHVVDRDGRTAAHTGGNCIDWCGSVADDMVSVAGNMLAGPAVVEATLKTYLGSTGAPLAERLMMALDAGQAEGGDKRGKQSAAMKVWSTEAYAMLDLRVDDNREPLAELRRLFAVAQQRYVPYMAGAATRANPAGVLDRAELDRRIAEHATSARPRFGGAWWFD